MINRVSIFTSRLIQTALLAVIFPTGVLADSPLVSANWLAEHLDDSKLVLLHVGSQKTYAKGHILGAQHVNTHADLSDPSSHSGDSLILELPAVDQLEAKLESLGISNDSEIVIYWSDDQITHATRALFTLNWAGLANNTRLLDGGLNAWKQSAYSLSTEPSTPTAGELSLMPHPELVVDADWVRQNSSAQGIALVDGRSRAHFDGIAKDRNQSGHIPNAGSTPWAELVDSDLHLKDSDALRTVFSAAGVEPDDTVVAYCHIGQYATLVMLAARTLGHEVKLYDGAFQDWSARGLPVSIAGND